MFIVIKKFTLIACAAVILICSAILIAFGAAQTDKTEEKTIVIDAGHGEPDGGSVASDGTKEATLNLEVSKALKKSLSESGFMVIMTREDESGIHKTEGSIKEKKLDDMKRRLKIKTSSSADIFVSIHMNKFEEKKYFGPQVLYDKTNENAKRLAEKIQESLNYIDPQYTRLAMGAESNIFLLKSSPVPSVIVECGFLSNENELEKLKTEEYRQTVSDAIFEGIKNYFDKN